MLTLLTHPFTLMILLMVVVLPLLITWMEGTTDPDPNETLLP